jgi:hypothetical protein
MEFYKMIKLKNLSIKVTTDYLKKYPTAAADGAKTKKEQIANIENAYSKVISPNIQTTKPDYLVSELLEHLYGYPKEKRNCYQEQYNRQKQTEMMIGELLERYIINVGKDYDWVFTGECIKAVDFLKKDGVNWEPWQIKNSDNTENSSAKDIRTGTKIQKWFRRFSKPRVIEPKIKKDGTLNKIGFSPNYLEEFERRRETNDTTPFQTPLHNWENFPDANIKKIVSEQGFKDFIFDYFKGKTIFGDVLK